MARLCARTFIWLVVSVCLAVPVQAADFTGKVVGITDGDTITVLVDRSPVKVRLYGIDCPEKRQPFGTAAKHFTSELAFGKAVTVVSLGKDSRGRTVADVFLPDHRLLNHELVKVGFAWWFRKYALGDETLKQLEIDARKAKRGLWIEKEPVPPWEWRRERHAPVRP
jgi:micrococcal nuclease